MGLRGPKERAWPERVLRDVRADFIGGLTFKEIMVKYRIPSRWYVRRMVRPVAIRMMKKWMRAERRLNNEE